MDLTVVAIPGFFSSMGLEYRYLKKQAATRDPIAGDYERRDTIASLSMGVGSLLAPILIPKLVKPVTPGRGKYGKALVGLAVGAAAATTIADVLERHASGLEAGVIPTVDPAAPANAAEDGPDVAVSSNRSRRRRMAQVARKVRHSAAPAAVLSGVLAGATTWAARTSAQRLWSKSGRDLGSGALATVGAIFAWDFIYYWNHRFMHESRWLWAIHVVHHSSEHYNLSTALRQPVADVLGVFLPMGGLSLLGFQPALIETARGVNLLYQYWVHTETIPKLGPIEEVFNTASHHRVHHGSNKQYLDRNHGSILIIWDRLFGTFEREDEPVRYGLTKNVESFNPLHIATHEHRDILRDVAASDNWSDRLNFAFRGPGWAYERHAARHEPQAEAGVA